VTAAYLRFPHLSGDLVAFVAAADVWLAPADGGRAWRLSDDGVPVARPRFSPDGSRVAWVSTRDGHAEVVVAPTEGGDAERLTWFGRPRCLVLGWRDDDHVLVASDVGEGERSREFVRSVGLDGSVERLEYGPASGLAVHRSGAVALSTPGSLPPAWWKRYRGGTAPQLWLDRRGTGAWQRLLRDVTASLVDPMWIGDTLVVTSDLGATFPDHADEQANLWAIDRKGAGELRQVTHHTVADGYVRDASTDGERIVYHARGELYRLDSLDGSPRRLDIRLGGSVAARRPRSLSPSEQLRQFRPDHGADASLVEWRGNVVLLAHREGPARVVVAEPGVRAREPRLLGRTGQAVVVTDRGGDDRLEVHDLRSPSSAPPRRTIGAGRLGRVVDLQPNPAGDAVAVCSHDGAVRLATPGNGRVSELHRCEQGDASSPAFSPDGRYLVWSEPVSVDGVRRLVGVDLSARRPVPRALTAGKFGDDCPGFSHDGKFLLFLSARTFDPSYDQHTFDLSFSAAVRPYLIPLAATEPAPFGPSADGWRLSPPDDPAPAAPPARRAAKRQASAAAPDTPPDAPVDPPASPDWDLDGFEERIVAFPVPSGNYRDLRAVHDGVAWIHLDAEQGVLGSRRAGTAAEPADALELFSFARRRLDVLADRVDGFAVSGDGRRLVVRDGDAVTVRPSDRAVKPDEPDCVSIDLSRLRLELDPVAEWHQMFDETIRLMTLNYWRADMNGVDWPAVTEHYRDALDRVASHDDLVDLLWEVVGELNTSHAYVRAPSGAGDRSRALGLLGADLSPAPGGWRIDRILPGESSDPDARSPLRAAGVGAAVGDVIVAVGGQPVDSRFGPATLLVGAAGKPIELTLRSGRTDRRVVVVPLADEAPLRYQDWVRGRAAYVDRRSKGRLGYVHIPDMTGLGWAQLQRDIHLAAGRDGLVVDVRYNGGGHTSQLVIERLGRRPVGWVTARDAADRQIYPFDSPRGPVVFVANEQAGSDGDIVNAAVQALGLGPVVGTRTWGGVVGIDGRYSLVDGTVVTQPKYSFYLDGKGWGVENHGVDPDIEVEIAPAELLHEDERDRQLDRAVDEALALLRRTPAATAPPLPPPRVR